MIEFILNHKKISTDANKSMTLVDFIRENSNLKGTKIVCREGDCGACTVLVGKLSSDKLSTHYHSITSCISPLANAHGKHIVTVEGLNLTDNLNKIQQSIKHNYASQCGFCTPGFVLAMANYCLNGEKNTQQHMLDAISGNICRCTGYVAIIKAAKQLVKESQSGGNKHTLDKLIEHGFIPAYFADITAQLNALNIHQQPKQPQSGHAIIAGATDLYVQKADALLQTPELRYITLETEKPIQINADRCAISGATTVTDLFEQQQLHEKIPKWQDYLRLLSSEAIRNMATVAGNFVNASPIGDMSVIFLAMDGILSITDGENMRTMALKDFFLDYKKIQLNPNEWITALNFALPSTHSQFNFEKVSKRKHLDIATVNTAIHISLHETAIAEVDIAIGGVAAIPKYLAKTCEFLRGKPINKATVFGALEIMNQEISPISDVRGSADYKRLLANQLFKAHFIKLFPQHIRFIDVA